MTSGVKQTRPRTDSAASSRSFRAGHARGVSKQVAQAKSSHTSDEFLRPFLAPSFDPAAFLNSNLPPLQQRSALSSAALDGPAPSGTAELSTQAQALLSQLNAHTTRLSNTLTQLTDDILRSGSRLAYEVEVLRGETLNLAETMDGTLQDDIRKFVPGGVHAEPGGDAQQQQQRQQQQPGEGQEEEGEAAAEPAYVRQLQTLKLVRERLDGVVKTFGDAMEFVFPPSELSVSSSFLSVSAPEPGSAQQSSEDKGQEVLRRLRDEVSTLLGSPEDPVEGIARAAQRVEELKELTTVWRGTAEERGRSRFIESLAKMVEDRHRDLMRDMEQAAKREERAEGGTRPRKSSLSRDAGSGGGGATAEDSRTLPGGFGLLNQLQRLRSGL